MGVGRVSRGRKAGVAHDVAVVVVLAAALAAVVFPSGAALEGSSAGKGCESVAGLLSSVGAAKAVDRVAVTPGKEDLLELTNPLAEDLLALLELLGLG